MARSQRFTQLRHHDARVSQELNSKVASSSISLGTGTHIYSFPHQGSFHGPFSLNSFLLLPLLLLIRSIRFCSSQHTHFPSNSRYSCPITIAPLDSFYYDHLCIFIVVVYCHQTLVIWSIFRKFFSEEDARRAFDLICKIKVSVSPLGRDFS